MVLFTTEYFQIIFTQPLPTADLAPGQITKSLCLYLVPAFFPPYACLLHKFLLDTTGQILLLYISIIIDHTDSLSIYRFALIQTDYCMLSLRFSRLSFQIQRNFIFHHKVMESFKHTVCVYLMPIYSEKHITWTNAINHCIYSLSYFGPL